MMSIAVQTFFLIFTSYLQLVNKSWLKFGIFAAIVVGFLFLVPIQPSGRFLFPGLSPGTGYWELSKGVVRLKSTGMPVEWTEVQGNYDNGWFLQDNGAKVKLKTTIFYLEMNDPGPPAQRQRFWRMWLAPRHDPM